MIANEYFSQYPVLQVRSYGLLAYDKREWHYKPRKDRTPHKQDNSHSNKFTTDSPNNQYTGSLTPYAKRRLKRAIQLLTASAMEKEAPNFKTGKTFKFKVNFVTLTLPAPQGNISDRDIKKQCLDPWIKRMRRKHKLNNYVWRAERQKNGNLHFHLITDTWIHYEKIRNDWNSVLNFFKFIDKFEEKHGHRNPNSTDVHAVWKVKNLTQYFIKYMTKGDKEGDKIEGKIWDCSKALKTKENCETLMEGQAYETWTAASNDPTVKRKDDPNFSIQFFTNAQFNKYVTGELLEKWTAYLTRIREFPSRELTLPPKEGEQNQQQSAPF